MTQTEPGPGHVAEPELPNREAELSRALADLYGLSGSQATNRQLFAASDEFVKLVYAGQRRRRRDRYLGRLRGVVFPRHSSGAGQRLALFGGVAAMILACVWLWTEPDSPSDAVVTRGEPTERNVFLTAHPEATVRAITASLRAINCGQEVQLTPSGYYITLDTSNERCVEAITKHVGATFVPEPAGRTALRIRRIE